MTIGRGTARVAGSLAGGVLAAVGLLHVAWGLDLTTWPFADEAALADTVVNVPVDQLPPAWTTIGLGALIVAAAAVVIGRVSPLSRRTPRWPFSVGIWVVVGALLLRAFNGFAQSGLFVSSIDTPYARWDAVFYSPLSLLLGLLCLVVALSPARRPRRRSEGRSREVQHARRH